MVSCLVSGTVAGLVSLRCSPTAPGSFVCERLGCRSSLVYGLIVSRGRVSEGAIVCTRGNVLKQLSFSFPWHSVSPILPEIAVGFHHDLEWPATEGRFHAGLREMASDAFGAHSSLPQTEEDVFLRFMEDSEDIIDIPTKAVGLVHGTNDSDSPGREIEDSSRQQRTPGKHVSTEKFQNSDGTTTFVTREEKVDSKGNTCSIKIVTKKLDPEGNEISRFTESSYSRTWGGKWPWSTDDNDQETHDDGAKKKGESDDEPKKKLSSWLWK
ncbi:hypothetical protein PpBr36_00469 [Pyricularia pennisetigena]|uniref:hypothetical protein n=1 Tax=Pyricularia pennisetigena TaxID=1578925 RepID=UPI00114D591B|nr:hypothetical protein PpBr36_00469 [Pyricularia pennisetigena]TLS28597.1 hypothetical protein PpBr36_00469 [Pyricularia pennisetigena]